MINNVIEYLISFSIAYYEHYYFYIYINRLNNYIFTYLNFSHFMYITNYYGKYERST